MIRKTGLVIITLILFQSFKIKDDSFTQYYQSLRTFDLPLFIDCRKEIQYPDYSYIPEKLDEKFRPEGSKTLGRIVLDQNIVSIIQIVQAENEFPVIYNYKKDGTPLDTLELLSGSCSSSPEFCTHSVSSISIDKSITMTDTSFYFRVNRRGFRHVKPDSIVIFNWQCKMNADGHFVKSLIKKEKK